MELVECSNRHDVREIPPRLESATNRTALRAHVFGDGVRTTNGMAPLCCHPSFVTFSGDLTIGFQAPWNTNSPK